MGIDFGAYDDLGADLEPLEREPIGGVAWTGRKIEGYPAKPKPSPETETEIPFLGGPWVPKRRRPLVLVPGILGTELEIYSLAPNGQRYNARRRWLPLDVSTLKVHNLKDLTAKQLQPLTESRDNPLVRGAYGGLLSFLQSELGYRLGEDLFVFGYNWTQSNAVSGRRLAGFVAKIVEAFAWGEVPAAERRVDLVCHSMGGLVARAAVQVFDAPTRRIAYLASPHYGAPKAYAALHPDVDMVSFFHELIDWSQVGLSPDDWLETTLKKLAAGFPSVYELLPDAFYFERRKHVCHIDDAGFDTWPKGWKETYVDTPRSKLEYDVRATEAMQFKRRLGKRLPGDPYLVIASTSQKTVDMVEINTTWGLDSVAYTYYGTPNGDGTVTFDSAKGPNRHVTVTGSHAAVPNLRETFWYLAAFLTAP